MVANTGDDIAAFGLHVSPDPDLDHILAGRRDRRAARLRHPRRHAQRLRTAGRDRRHPTGSNSATRISLPACCAPPCSTRAHRLTGITTSSPHALWTRTPLSCRCATRRSRPTSRTEGEWRHFQEYLILQRSEPELQGVEYRGVEQATSGSDEVRSRDRDRGADRDRVPRTRSRASARSWPCRACARRSSARRAGRCGQPAGRGQVAQGAHRGLPRWAGLDVRRWGASPPATRVSQPGIVGGQGLPHRARPR